MARAIDPPPQLTLEDVQTVFGASGQPGSQDRAFRGYCHHRPGRIRARRLGRSWAAWARWVIRSSRGSSASSARRCARPARPLTSAAIRTLSPRARRSSSSSKIFRPASWTRRRGPLVGVEFSQPAVLGRQSLQASRQRAERRKARQAWRGLREKLIGHGDSEHAARRAILQRAALQGQSARRRRRGFQRGGGQLTGSFAGGIE